MLGVGFGALRAAAIVVIFILFARGIGMNNTQWWKGSQLLSYFKPAASYVEAMLPEEWQNDPADNAGSEQETIQDKVIEQVIDNLNQ